MVSSLMTSPAFRFLFPLLLLGAVSLGMDNIIEMTRANWGIASNLPY
ncbi:GGDEF domain-containing protein, partial [Vibrio rotiferianus]